MGSASWGGGKGCLWVSYPSSMPSTIIVKDHELDHSASPHLQASKQGEADRVKQERFQLDNRRGFFLPDSSDWGCV